MAALGSNACAISNVNADPRLLTADFSVQLETANGIWARQTILPAYLATNQTYYGATLGTLDGAPGTVNAWVNQKTQGRIPTLLDPALDCASLDAILVNAIYFKGSWTSAFTASATATAPFTRQDGTQVSCPMMAHQVTMGCRTTALANRLTSTLVTTGAHHGRRLCRIAPVSMKMP